MSGRHSSHLAADSWYSNNTLYLPVNWKVKGERSVVPVLCDNDVDRQRPIDTTIRRNQRVWYLLPTPEGRKSRCAWRGALYSKTQ